MNRKDLINYVAEDLEISKIQAKEQLNFVLSSLKSAISSCDKLYVSPLGSFSIKKIGSKNLKHIITKEPFTTEPRQYIKFKPSSDLKRFINEEDSN